MGYNTRQIFTDDQEADFVEYIKFRSKIAFGMSLMEVRKAAYQLAMSNKVKNVSFQEN